MKPIDRKRFIAYLDEAIPAILDAPKEVLNDKEAHSRILGSVTTSETLRDVIAEGAFSVQSEETR